MVLHGRFHVKTVPNFKTETALIDNLISIRAVSAQRAGWEALATPSNHIFTFSNNSKL